MRHTLIALAASLCVIPSEQPEGGLRSAHEGAQHSKRRVIFNNDGDDVIYTTGGATPESLWAVRGAPVVGSQVDTMFYCVSTGIGMFRVPVPFGDLLTKDHFEDAQNITGELVAQGTDPLEVMVDYTDRHGIELFASFRMNDVHDGAYPERGDEYLSQWKKDHPDWLHGSPAKKPPFGYWSGADYGQPEVRDYVFNMIEYISTHYAIDGVELDFWRHPPHFRTCAWGERATDEQRTVMTDLIRRIRAMAWRAAEERGRPLLISVRMLESPEISFDQGLDIAAWLREDLFDLLVTGEFSQDNWAELIALGHAYEVPVYPGLRRNFRKDPGYLASLRGQALTAHHLDADGVYLFNLFPERLQAEHSTLEPFFTYGDPATLQGLDKLYSFTRDNAIMDRYFAHGVEYLQAPGRDLTTPFDLLPFQRVRLPLEIWDEIAGADEPPAVRVRATFAEPAMAEHVTFMMNGVPCVAENGGDGKEQIFYECDRAAFRRGSNVVGLWNRSDQRVQLWDIRLSVDYPD